MEPLSSFEKPTSTESQPRPPSTASEARDGLSETEARKRLAQFGFNELVEEAVHPLRQFLGVIPLSDPPREDSKATIEAAAQMGIKLKMVTGDQLAIAKEIARQVGLGTNLLDASLFTEMQPHQSGQMTAAIEQADGFAQVFPEHKYHLVDVLQQEGQIVGMTGDGVNDAPALKKADAGIAVAEATDAARAAADIVLLTPGLSVTIDAIKESRKIFQRMNSYAIYRIAETIRVLVFMTLYKETNGFFHFLNKLRDTDALTAAY